MTGRIAHINIAVLKAPWGDPRVAGFVDNVERVNAAAERSTGFVKNLDIDPGELHRVIFGGSAAIDPDCEAATLSVWDSAADLGNFVHRTIHGRFLARRGEWFDMLDPPTHVIWPIAEDCLPTLEEARAALDRLARDGPSDMAYQLAASPDRSRRSVEAAE